MTQDTNNTVDNGQEIHEDYAPVVSTSVGSIQHFPTDNCSRAVQTAADMYAGDTDKNALINTIANGWSEQQGTINIVPMTNGMVERALAERQARWDELRKLEITIKLPREKLVDGESMRKTYQLSPSEMQATFEAMYVRDGKLIVPKYYGIMGYRRFGILVEANVVRKIEEQPLIMNIPCRVKHYKDELSMIYACIEENALKMTGIRKLEGPDILKSAKLLVDKGANEGRLRNLFGVGTAQKMYKIIALHARFPNAGIIPMLLTRKVDMGPLDKEDLRKLYNNKADAETVVRYFRNPKAAKGNTGKGNAPKMASKDAIKQSAETCDVAILKEQADAILENRVTEVNRKYLPFAAVINKFTAMLTGELPKVEGFDDFLELLKEEVVGVQAPKELSPLDASAKEEKVDEAIKEAAVVLGMDAQSKEESQAEPVHVQAQEPEPEPLKEAAKGAASKGHGKRTSK